MHHNAALIHKCQKSVSTIVVNNMMLMKWQAELNFKGIILNLQLTYTREFIFKFIFRERQLQISFDLMLFARFMLC